MADLSKLTDEQLQVYREMLAEKQGSVVPGAPGGTPPPTPKPTLPAGLAAGHDVPNFEQPSYGSRVLANLPGSAARALPHPSMGGGGMIPTDKQGNAHMTPPMDSLRSTANALMHPIDTAKEMFAEDPVGTAQIPILAGRGLATPTVRGGFSGAAKAIPEEAGTLMRNTDLRHPLKTIADTWPALKRIGAAASEGVSDARYADMPKGPSDKWIGGVSQPEAPQTFAPIRGPLPSGRIPGKPAFDASTGEMLAKEPGGQFTSPVNTKAVPSEHPPFAPTQPFSPSRVARQMTPSRIIGAEPTGVRGNPKALEIAKKLKAALEE